MHKTDGKQTNLANLLCSLLLGGLLALGLELLLLLLGAVVVSNGILSDDASVQIATAACVLGCFGGGLFVCRRWNARRLLAGLAVGGLCFLLIVGVGLTMGGGLEMGSRGMLELAACLCGGAVAGLLSRKKKKGKKSPRRGK